MRAMTSTAAHYFYNGLSDYSSDESEPDSLHFINVVPEIKSRAKSSQCFQNGYDGSSEDETEHESLEFVNVIPKTLPKISKGRNFLNGDQCINDDEDIDLIKNLTHVNNLQPRSSQNSSSEKTKGRNFLNGNPYINDDDPIKNLTHVNNFQRTSTHHSSNLLTKGRKFLNGNPRMNDEEETDPIKNLTHVNNLKHTSAQHSSTVLTKGRHFINGNPSMSDDEDIDPIKTLTHVNYFQTRIAENSSSLLPKMEKDLSHMGVQTNSPWADTSTLFFNNGDTSNSSDDEDIKSELTFDNTLRPETQHHNRCNFKVMDPAQFKNNIFQSDWHKDTTNGNVHSTFPTDFQKDTRNGTVRTESQNDSINGNKNNTMRLDFQTNISNHYETGNGRPEFGKHTQPNIRNDTRNSGVSNTLSADFQDEAGSGSLNNKAREDFHKDIRISVPDDGSDDNMENTSTKKFKNTSYLTYQNRELDKQATEKFFHNHGEENYQSHELVVSVNNEKTACSKDLAENSQIQEPGLENHISVRLILNEEDENINDTVSNQTQVVVNKVNETLKSKVGHNNELSLKEELQNGAPYLDKPYQPQIALKDLSTNVETTETNDNTRDLETNANIEIADINKIVSRPDIPFRNTFGPLGIRPHGINVFEARLQENIFDKKNVSNQSNIGQNDEAKYQHTTEISTHMEGDDSDLEIDGEKSHTFKDALKEKLKKQNNKETDIPSPNTTTQGIVKSSLSRQYSLGAYGHTCSGCGRKDCDGNFMRLLREMIRTGRKKGYEIRNVVPDGNCMFAAVIDQLELLGDCRISPLALRQSCTQYLKSNPTSQDGTPFVLFIDGETWEEYLSRMGQEGQWGDHLMLQAISCVTERIITVINGDDETKWTIIHPACTAKPESLFLGHVGELHYVSMRPVIYKELAEEEFMSIDLYSPMPSLPNFDDLSQQQMFKEDYVDPWCDIPTIHLTFLIKQFIPLKSTIKNADSMCHQAFAIESSTEDYMGQRSNTGREFNIKAIGDVVEGLFAASLDEHQLPESNTSGEWADVGIIYSLTTCIAYPPNMNNIGTIDPSDVSVDTKYTHPGYVRLLARYPDTWGLESDESAMSYYIPNTHKRFEDAEGIQRFKNQYANQNPAIIYLFRRMFSGVFSPFWPEEASAWRSRPRDSGWPSPELIDSIVSEGVYYISQPHVNSSNPGIEFQTSFAVAERRLANGGLSKEQRYCFIVFKALISHTLRGDDLINSGHLKSVFFQASEIIPQQYWASRLSGCILYMVDSLTRQLEFGNLPDYFILSNNLIDHLSSDQIQKTLEKLSNLRTNPISVLYSIAYQNMVTNADDIFQLIRHDIDDFQQHKSVRQSVIETLVPAKIKQAVKYIEVNNYDIALEIIQEAHEDRLMVSTCEDNIPFVAFVTEVTNSFGLSKQWWLCLHADDTLRTTLSIDLSLQHDPIPLKEIVGHDTADKYGDLLIPKPLAENLFSFCVDFYLYLTLKHKKKMAVAFLVKGREFFLHIQKYGGLPSDFPCTINTDDYHIDKIYRIYKCLVQNFVVTMSAEPLCSLGLDEIANEVQTICERVNTEEAYTILVLMWKYLGDTEKFNQASRKLDEFDMTRQPNE